MLDPRAATKQPFPADPLSAPHRVGTGGGRFLRWLALPVSAGVMLFLLNGCASRLAPRDFAAASGADAGAGRFEPDRFFLGKTHSWGVFEDRTGANPVQRFKTECFGRREVNGEVTLDQTFTYDDGRTQKRHWRIRRLDDHRYEATASDVVGIARGEADGNAFHWEYTVALKPGNPLFNVRLKQWMYGQPDGRTMLNRGTISKFGVTIAQVAEEFRRGQ